MHTFNCYQLQLAEIRLFTEDGLATIVDAGNPGGWSAGNIQGPTAVFDEDLDSKWDRVGVFLCYPKKKSCIR